MEKHSRLPLALALPLPAQAAKGKRTWRPLLLLPLLLLTAPLLTRHLPALPLNLPAVLTTTPPAPYTGDTCAQLAPLFPTTHAAHWQRAKATYAAPGYLAEAAEHLGGIVRIDTVVYDNWGPPAEDDRWAKFAQVQVWLEHNFPLVYAHLQFTTVNKYGLVYHWPGSDSTLKPLMLTAHQDVVPIDPVTASQWLHPPFSGYYDGEWIWGRGAGDQKSGLVGILLAVETLLAQGFAPRRGVILAFGFDEEASGKWGAESISRYLMSTFGLDSVGLLIDEGGGLAVQGEQLFAMPCVGEKGYVDVRVEVTTPGGHSSVPEPHTGIGYLSALITLLESHPNPTLLTRTNPYYENLVCAATFGSLPAAYADDIIRSRTDDAALKRVEAVVAGTKQGRAMIGTTQAADLVGGGSVKVNALPEKVWAVVNHRISVDSSVQEVKDRFVALLQPYALANALSLTAFGLNVTHPAPGPGPGQALNGHITLSQAWTPSTQLEPAPVSPHTRGAPAWDLLAGTIRAVWDDTEGGAVVSPSVTGGNTDTRYYWKLTKAIYRYGGMKATDSYNGAHTGADVRTVNEAIRASGFVDRIKFYTAIILNADESDL
ncbi:carboxypeptidase S [Calocera cornea HHB12733]|uniref:Carboxypeptidase S n=1 Tax=Calocera cornea HHB12733 TaxID=1353952 RepID=A0A165CZD6_9BASI|nr:carboxypeptidase S [Calocera cornea HHB12733]